jgi:lipoyltransferase and lipoate-protein ligase
MHCINLETNDPYFNLALEELLLKSSKEEYFILFVNNPSVIIGKHQSGHIEVNTKFVTKNQIPVIRRISGGGTVYHDLGNLNFSFIRQSESGKQVDFRKYTRPVIDFLKQMGIDARFEGKNDLKIDGLKISGNSEHIHGNRVLHHGTLLFNTQLEILRNCIRIDKSCYSSRAVASNPASVVNLAEKMGCFDNIAGFKTAMMDFFLKSYPETYPYELSEIEILEAESIALSKYQTWEWNWAYGPEYSFKNNFQINKVSHSCNFFVKDGIIVEIDVTGSEEMMNASKNLMGCRHMVKEVSEVFLKYNIHLEREAIFNFF